MEHTRTAKMDGWQGRKEESPGPRVAGPNSAGMVAGLLNVALQLGRLVGSCRIRAARRRGRRMTSLTLLSWHGHETAMSMPDTGTKERCIRTFAFRGGGGGLAQAAILTEDQAKDEKPLICPPSVHIWLPLPTSITGSPASVSSKSR